MVCGRGTQSKLRARGRWLAWSSGPSTSPLGVAVALAPVSLHSVELIRDGGSFAAVFSAADSVTYQLRFPIKHSSSPQLAMVVGHDLPVVGVQVVIHEDGVRVGHNLKDQRTLSWAEAQILLDQLRPLLSDQSDLSRRSYEEMVGVAAREGAPPNNRWRGP